eukprot:15349129-Ditylum_brightwellii.AAC.1
MNVCGIVAVGPRLGGITKRCPTSCAYWVGLMTRPEWSWFSPPYSVSTDAAGYKLAALLPNKRN